MLIFIVILGMPFAGSSISRVLRRRRIWTKYRAGVSYSRALFCLAHSADTDEEEGRRKKEEKCHSGGAGKRARQRRTRRKTKYASGVTAAQAGQAGVPCARVNKSEAGALGGGMTDEKAGASILADRAAAALACTIAYPNALNAQQYGVAVVGCGDA